MKFLDCTLRDGGYYTNWDFDGGLVETYLDAMENLPVDIIEVGYRSVPQKGYVGEYFYCPVKTLEQVREIAPSKKVAIMFNEVDTSPEDGRKLLKPVEHLVDIVRLAVKPRRFDEAVTLARSIRDQGFEVAFNLMYMSNILQDPEVLEYLPKLNGAVDYFNLVDSFGGVYPEEVRETVASVREKLDMEIGFHGHNNMELAFVNAMTAVDSGCSIVDGTITGMGRGAGNLKTELFLTWLSVQHGLDVDFNRLSNVVADFEELKDTYQWGTTLPYMVSGVSSLHPQQVMDWVTKRTYSMNSIIRALQNKQVGSKDNLKLPVLDKEETYDKALLIAGGPSAVKHAVAVKSWIEQNRDGLILVHVSSRNVKPYEELDVPQVYSLVGNEGIRLENTFENLNTVNGRCLLPPYPREMGTYIPDTMKGEAFELDKVDFTDRFTDSHTAISLQAIINFDVDEVYAVGFDGYKGAVIGDKEKDLLKENDYLFKKFKDTFSKIVSLTPTEYTQLETASVYNFISEME